MTIKITSCDNPRMWYASKIKQLFEVIPLPGDDKHWLLAEDEKVFKRRVIRKDECVVISE